MSIVISLRNRSRIYGGKVNEGRCVFRGACWGVGGVSECDVRGLRDDFLVSLRIL